MTNVVALCSYRTVVASQDHGAELLTVARVLASLAETASQSDLCATHRAHILKSLAQAANSLVEAAVYLRDASQGPLA